MEEQKTAAAAPAPNPPVMDVKPPEPVASPPPEAEVSKSEPTPPPADKKADPPKSPAPKPAQESSNGVTAAIVATVIIVFGLSAVAVMAYLQSK